MKLIGFLTGKLIIFLFCLFVIQGCVTTNGILQNATNLESKGMYCDAVWNELTRLEDDPSLKRDELILRIGNKCILSSINEAKQILNNSVTSNDFENVLNKINLAKQKVSDINFKFHSNIVKWEPAYQQLENQIILKLKEELYQDAFVLFSQKDFENAEMVYDKIYLFDKNYKDIIKLKEDCNIEITESTYINALTYFKSGDLNRAIVEFDKVNKRKLNYKETIVKRQVCYDNITKQLFAKGLDYYNLKNYREAYKILNPIKIREKVNILFPELDNLVNECYEKSTVKIFFDGNNNLSNQIYSKLIANNNNDAIKFVGAINQADYVIVVSNDFIEHQPEEKKSPKTGYRIRVWNETYLDTNYKPNRNISISKYEATYPIKYYDVTKTIKVTCNVLYTIRGRYSKSGNFSSEKSSSINYLECKNISLGELIQYKIFPTSTEIIPSESFIQKFNIPYLKSAEVLKNESCQVVLNELINSIIRDLNLITAYGN